MSEEGHSGPNNWVGMSEGRKEEDRSKNLQDGRRVEPFWGFKVAISVFEHSSDGTWCTFFF